MARTIPLKNLSALIEKRHWCALLRSHSALVILQILVFVCACNLLKLVKSLYSNKIAAARFINSKSISPCT